MSLSNEHKTGLLGKETQSSTSKHKNISHCNQTQMPTLAIIIHGVLFDGKLNDLRNNLYDLQLIWCNLRIYALKFLS